MTILSLYGVSRFRNDADFSGKVSAEANSKATGNFTRLGLGGYSRGELSGLSGGGKASGPFGGLGLLGIPWRASGPFTGKSGGGGSSSVTGSGAGLVLPLSALGFGKKQLDDLGSPIVVTMPAFTVSGASGSIKFSSGTVGLLPLTVTASSKIIRKNLGSVSIPSYAGIGVGFVGQAGVLVSFGGASMADYAAGGASFKKIISSGGVVFSPYVALGSATPSAVTLTPADINAIVNGLFAKFAQAGSLGVPGAAGWSIFDYMRADFAHAAGATAGDPKRAGTFAFYDPGTVTVRLSGSVDGTGRRLTTNVVKST